MQIHTLCAVAVMSASALSAQTLGSWVNSGVGCPARVADIGAGDDTVSVGFDLGFTFPHPGGVGATSRIDIASNGYVYLESGTITSSRCCNGASAALVPIAGFFNDTPSFALFGQDLNPSVTSATGAGSIWFETDGRVATVSWDMVGEFGNAGASNTCQIQLYDDGRVVMCWTNVAAITHDALVGFSPGGMANDPGPVDFSTAGTYPVFGTAGDAIYETFARGTVDLSGLCTEWIPDGSGSYIVLSSGAPLPCCVPAEPMSIDSQSTPTIGQSTAIDISGIPAGTVSGAILLGAGSINPALDLSFIGAPGCFLRSRGNVGSLPFATGGSTATLTLPISSDRGAVGLTFALQGVAIAPGINPFGVVFSNLGDLTVGDTNPIRITASGTNSFNSATTSGFFKIQNGNSLSITAVTFDWAASSNPAQATMTFDTDQTGMADRFDAGNSTIGACAGTYRNGSDVTTGLVFTGTPAATACAAGSTTGWTTTGTVGGANRDVSFSFTSFGTGDTFEVDIDTDGGAGITGGAMAGMVVTVTLSDGSTRTGELQMVTANDAQLDL